MREHVINALVAWRLAGKIPDDDPERVMYRLIDSATWPELCEAMKRLAQRMQQ